MTQSELIDELKKINIYINDKQLEQLNRYYELLIYWNEKINLTGITKKEDVYLKHFYDSLTINKIIDLTKIDSLCDIGTGAGFPGLVLKIVFPNINITLIDSLNKRIKFLDIVIDELDLKGIKTIHSRIEDYGVTNREMFDVVTSRAVASLNILLEYSIPLVKVDGYFIAMKSDVESELQASKNAFYELDCELTKQDKFKLPKEDSLRTLLKIKKTRVTSKKFPRKYSEIKNKKL